MPELALNDGCESQAMPFLAYQLRGEFIRPLKSGGSVRMPVNYFLPE